MECGIYICRSNSQQLFRKRYYICNTIRNCVCGSAFKSQMGVAPSLQLLKSGLLKKDIRQHLKFRYFWWNSNFKWIFPKDILSSFLVRGFLSAPLYKNKCARLTGADQKPVICMEWWFYYSLQNMSTHTTFDFSVFVLFKK